MTNTTSTYWAIDGVSLQTYAYNIETWGGDRQAPPSLRGDNLTIPFRTGQTFLPKVPDQRTMTLAMWVQGCLPDGSAPKGIDQRAQFEANWYQLRALLWQPYRQFSLQKRVVYPDGTVHVATAQAQYAGGLNPTMSGTLRAEFTVDLILADPYFYCDPITQSIGTTTQFTVLGDARTTKINFSLAGPRTNPSVALSVAGADPLLTYGGTIAQNDTINLDVDNAVATYRTSTGVTSTRTGLVTNSNSFYWFYLDPGVNTVLSPSGSGTLAYQPAFL